MNEEQLNHIKRLICAYGQAEHELGSIESSYYWNRAANKRDKAEQELNDYLKSLLIK